eukprot:jgi/Tetstr1/445674/TSEL_003479.t1
MIRNGVRIPLKDGPPGSIHQGVSMEDATPDQLRFMDGELARFLASGACHFRGCRMLPYMENYMFFASSRA